MAENCKVDDCQQNLLRAEIACLRALLKPFCEADWYSMGNGMYEGRVSGAVLTEAKAAMSGEEWQAAWEREWRERVAAISSGERTDG